MTPNIVLPIGMTFEIWVQRLISTFPNDNIPLPPPVKEWWGWAAYLMQIPKFISAPVPDKKIFPYEESWELWAILFIQTTQAS